MCSDLPRTAIIGAGLSGLVAGKMLNDYGIPYECFETSDRVGGNWAFENPNGYSSAYRSLHIDTSKQRLSLKDFPMPPEYPDFPHHSQIKEYLDSYVDAFGLVEHIRFRTAVRHALRLPDGGWQLNTENGETHFFDALVVATGHHWDPRFPGFPGEFTGESIHSHHYVDPDRPLDMHDKRILVVGIGNSGADVVSELSQKSNRNRVALSTRSGAWVVPKYMFGLPGDKLARTVPQLPGGLQRALVRKLPVLLSGKPESYGLPRPNHNFLEAHPTMSSELLLRIGSGDATVKPDVERLDGSQVDFVDGTNDEFDVIVYATGYNISFPFFDPDLVSAPDNKISLYKRILKPGLDDLAFVGFAQALPTLFPFVESQARMVAAYLAGTYRPPSDAVMERVIVADEKRHAGHFADSPRHTQQVDYFVYEHDMRTRELPAGLSRARLLGQVRLAGRAPTVGTARP